MELTWSESKGTAEETDFKIIFQLQSGVSFCVVQKVYDANISFV